MACLLYPAAAVLGLGAGLVAELCDLVLEVADQIERLESEVR
jgi:hypothetical protein